MPVIKVNDQQFSLRPGPNRLGAGEDVDVAVADPTVCSDPWSGTNMLAQASVTEVAPQPFPLPIGAPGYLRMTVDVAMPNPVAITAGTKYQAMTVRIRRVKTVGPGSCAAGRPAAGRAPGRDRSLGRPRP